MDRVLERVDGGLRVRIEEMKTRGAVCVCMFVLRSQSLAENVRAL